jgi:hypothetical protein
MVFRNGVKQTKAKCLEMVLNKQKKNEIPWKTISCFLVPWNNESSGPI